MPIQVGINTMSAVDGKNLLTEVGMAPTNEVRTLAKSNSKAKMSLHFLPQTQLRHESVHLLRHLELACYLLLNFAAQVMLLRVSMFLPILTGCDGVLLLCQLNTEGQVLLHTVRIV
jgi:hypothetical protein